jgi:hypothetical protein
MTEHLGFVISRHITLSTHADLCFRAYRSVREFYPDSLVMIVDDRSTLSDPHAYDARTNVIQSAFAGSGEFGLYHYFHQLRPFDRAVFLHDSMVLKKPLELPDVPVIYLWHFAHHDSLWQHVSDVESLLSELERRDEIEQKYRSGAWTSMFGCCCSVTWDCLDRVTRRYQLFRLLKRVDSRMMRCAMERVLGVVFCSELDQTKPSLNGNIFGLPGAFERDRLLEHYEGSMDKTWHGR